MIDSPPTHAGSDADDLTIAKGACGSLSFCAACRMFGLELGTTYLSLGPGELLRLLAVVESLIAERPANRGLGRAHVGVGGTRFRLSLDPAGLRAARGLLRQGVALAKEHCRPKGSRPAKNWVH